MDNVIGLNSQYLLTIKFEKWFITLGRKTRQVLKLLKENAI